MRKLLEKHRASGNALPLIGGHRGCVCQYPENTIQAMEEGLRQGASYLEIDIQLTRDGIPVVYHDTDVSAKTGLPGYVHQYSYAELREHWPLETFEDVMNWGRAGDVCFALAFASLAACFRSRLAPVKHRLNKGEAALWDAGDGRLRVVERVLYERVVEGEALFVVQLFRPFVVAAEEHEAFACFIRHLGSPPLEEGGGGPPLIP